MTGRAVPDRDILIAGAGIAGLATALALRTRGIGSTLIERRADAVDAGLAINLPGNAIAALRRLGLGDAMEEMGRPIRRREYRTSNGRLLFAVDEDAFWGAALRPRAVRRGDLLRLLTRALPPSCIRTGAVERAEQDASRVVAHLSDGGALPADLLIGADGVSSAVRRAPFGETDNASAQIGNASWRFMAPNPGVDCWTVWAKSGAIILLMPVDTDEVYGWATTGRGRSAPEGDELAGAFERFPAMVRAAIAAALSSPTALHHSPLVEVRLPAWSDRRIVLVGDAAHAMAPVWAQGAAMALEDALTLAELLAGATNLAAVGAQYEARRRARVDHVSAMTDRMSRAAQLPSIVRDLLLPLIGPRSYAATYGPLKTDG